MEIKSLANTDFDKIYAAFSKAFADYEMQVNKEQLRAMVKRRGFHPALSFAAFEGEQIVAFTLNGIGNFNGIPTAYDTGTGTLSAYRGKGLATRIFEYSIPYLKENNIRQYLLEVLQHNDKAVSVYRNIGFEVTREFYYFNQQNNEITNPVKMPDSSYSVKQIELEHFYPTLTEFWDFEPSWQNSLESVQRSVEEFVQLGVFADEKLVGYCVFEPVSGDVTQLAVDKPYRRRGIASLLVQRMIELNKNNVLKVVNTDIACDSITQFLQAMNIPVRGKQFEMVKKL